MTTSARDELCAAHDQVAGRSCRYYKDHGGRHNFARLDHDCALERELRRELDQRTSALAEAIGLFDAAWCTEHGHAPRPDQFKRIDELRAQLPAGTQPQWADLYAEAKAR
ncbi:MAG TPA: hypothetical protein VLE97_08705 [Gaiellaceae bacterium]|nr:hypothetical protein [Gaiellaceae bacterium]